MTKKVMLTIMLVLCLGLALTAPAQAGDYPDKPIKMVIPWSPGGGSDIAGRTLAGFLNPLLGQELVVVNVTGGGGTVAGREVMNSKPDGYTLFFPHTSLLTAFHTGTADFNYDKFTRICRLVTLNQAFLIRSSSPYKNLAKLLDHARKNPNTIKAGCVIGSLSHYVVLGLQEAAGVKFRIVPQKGESKRIVALKGGHIDLSPFTLTSVNKYIGSGDFRAVGVASEKRDPTMPNIPTCKEQGYNVIGAYNYYWFAPQGLGADKVRYLNGIAKKALSDPKVTKALAQRNVIPDFIPHNQVDQALDKEDKYLAGIAQRNKLKRK